MMVSISEICKLLNILSSSSYSEESPVMDGSSFLKLAGKGTVFPRLPQFLKRELLPVEV